LHTTEINGEKPSKIAVLVVKWKKNGENSLISCTKFIIFTAEEKISEERR
jgi:hypothetical protein